LEAMSYGSPVITSNTTSMPEVANNAALLINPRNPREICEATERIIQNSKLRKKLVKKGLSRVKKFSWEKCARETLEVLNRVMSS